MCLESSSGSQLSSLLFSRVKAGEVIVFVIVLSFLTRVFFSSFRDPLIESHKPAPISWDKSEDKRGSRAMLDKALVRDFFCSKS